MSKAIPAADIFRWLRQVQADREVSEAGFRAAFVISQLLHREKGYAHPSMPYLANAVGKQERATQAAVTKLQLRGHLTVSVGGGRGRANEYQSG